MMVLVVVAGSVESMMMSDTQALIVRQPSVELAEQEELALGLLACFQDV